MKVPIKYTTITIRNLHNRTKKKNKVCSHTQAILWELIALVAAIRMAVAYAFEMNAMPVTTSVTTIEAYCWVD